MYLVKATPFDERTDQIVEVGNETTVLLVLTILLGYADGNLDPLVGSTIGFLLLGLVLLCVVINALLFLYATGKFVYLKVK
jgi:hypothetical protein